MADHYEDFVFCKLTQAVNSTATDLHVDDVSAFPDNTTLAGATFYMTFESSLTHPNTFEIVQVLSVDADTAIVSVTRGAGSAASAHTVGTYLKASFTAEMARNLANGQTGGALSTLTDVAVSSPVSGDTLTFDGTHWVNTAGSGGGGADAPALSRVVLRAKTEYGLGGVVHKHRDGLGFLDTVGGLVGEGTVELTPTFTPWSVVDATGSDLRIFESFNVQADYPPRRMFQRYLRLVVSGLNRGDQIVVTVPVPGAGFTAPLTQVYEQTATSGTDLVVGLTLPVDGANGGQLPSPVKVSLAGRLADDGSVVTASSTAAVTELCWAVWIVGGSTVTDQIRPEPVSALVSDATTAGRTDFSWDDQTGTDGFPAVATWAVQLTGHGANYGTNYRFTVGEPLFSLNSTSGVPSGFDFYFEVFGLGKYGTGGGNYLGPMTTNY